MVVSPDNRILRDRSPRSVGLVRLVSWVIVALAFLGVASLVALPLLARGAAERTNFARPEALPPERKLGVKSLVTLSVLLAPGR